MCAGMAACGTSAGGDEDKAEDSKAAVTAEKKDETKADDKDSPEESKAEDDKNDAESKSDDGAKDESKANEKKDNSKTENNSESGKTSSDGAYISTNEATTDTVDIDGTNEAKLINGNIIYIEDSYSDGLEAKPADDEIVQVINTAIKQYDAAQSQDCKAFLDTLGLGLIKKPFMEITHVAIEHEDDFDEYLETNKMQTKYETLNDIVSLLEDIGDIDIMNEIDEAYDNKDYDKIEDLLDKLVASITPESDTVKEGLEYDTIYDIEEDYKLLDGINEDTTYAFIVEYCGRNDGELYINFDLSVVTEDTEFFMSDINAWIIDGKCGVWIDYAEDYDRDKEIMGMTTKEIWDMMVQLSQEDIPEEQLINELTESAAQ